MELHNAAGSGGIETLISHAPSRLWTPAQGPSGLVIVAPPRPLLAVVGNRILAVEAGRPAPWGRREASVTLGGLIVISPSRRSEPARVIGHPDLASGTSVRQGESLYVSIAEAVYRQGQGEEVEIHFAPSAEDDQALAGFRARARRRWEGDRLPDGWTRPLPPPAPKDEAPPARGGDDLPEELRTLAEQIRAKAATRPADGRGR